MKKIFYFMKKYYHIFLKKIIVYYVLSILVTLLSLISPYIIGRFIDLFSGDKNMSDIQYYCFIFSVISIFSIILSFFKNRLYIKVQTLVSFNIIKDLIVKMQTISLIDSKKYDISYINQRINNDANEITIGTMSFVEEIVSNFVMIVFSIFIVSSFDFILSLVMVISSLLYILIYNLMKNLVYKINIEMMEAQSEFFSKSNFQIENLRFSKIYCLHKKLLKIFEKSFLKLFYISLKKQKFDYLYSFLDSIISIGIQIFIFLYGGYLVLNNVISIGELSVLSVFFYKLLGAISVFFNLGQSIQTLKANMSRIEELIMIEDEEKGHIVIDYIDSIKLENIRFKYSENYVIDKFSYYFEKGKIYSIYGKNGCGKSTILDLIIGLYNNKYDGNIYFNNIDIKNIDTEVVRKNLMSITEQKIDNLPFLFDDTNNIDLELFRQFIKCFNLNNYINFTNNSITINKNNIYEFSIGEIQKLDLSWTISKYSDVLILDEPTSALDNISKDKFIKHINQIKNNKIILIVTHDEIFKSISDKIINFDIHL